MAKRKNADSEEEDEEEFVDQLEDDSEEDEELVQPPKTTKPPLPGRNTAQKNKKSQDSGSEDEEPIAKKPKISASKKPKKKQDEASGSEEEPIAKKTTRTGKAKAASPNTDDGEIVVRKTKQGDKYIELGKKKRVGISSFKGNTLIDIREFYGEEGDEKPGKKGISLTREQWETLKNSTSAIDKIFEEVSSGGKKKK